jgi:hypothetical protein
MVWSARLALDLVDELFGASTRAVADALAAAGHRGDRLTAAALSLAHLPRDAVRRTLASVARAAARWSLLSGDVPAGSAADAADLLAAAGVSARTSTSSVLTSPPTPGPCERPLWPRSAPFSRAFRSAWSRLAAPCRVASSKCWRWAAG